MNADSMLGDVARRTDNIVGASCATQFRDLDEQRLLQLTKHPFQVVIWTCSMKIIYMCVKVNAAERMMNERRLKHSTHKAHVCEKGCEMPLPMGWRSTSPIDLPLQAPDKGSTCKVR